MELQEAISKFKTDLAEVKAGGKSEVEIQNLEGYLDALKAQASMSTEQRRQAHESGLAQYNATLNNQLENFRQVMAAGKEAINASIIINGGAVIALMSFMGNSVGKSKTNYLMALAYPLFMFGAGVFCGGVAFGTRYISQFFYADFNSPKKVRCGHWFNAISWLLIISSYLAFLIAVFGCYGSFLAS